MIARFNRSVFLVAVIGLATSFAAANAQAQLTAEAQEEPEAVVKVYYLRFISAGDAVNTIERLYHGRRGDKTGMQIAIDERSNSFIVSASMEAHEQVAELLQLLDTEAPAEREAKPAKPISNVQVEVYWIADVDLDDTEQFGAALKELPSSIAGLVESKLTERLSLKNPKLVSRVYIQSIVQDARAGNFEAQRLGKSGENGLVFSTQGILSKTSDDQYQIDVRLEVEVANDMSEVNTLISTKLDHPVCLALAQTGALDSVFIVRLTSTDE